VELIGAAGHHDPNACCGRRKDMVKRVPPGIIRHLVKAVEEKRYSAAAQQLVHHIRAIGPRAQVSVHRFVGPLAQPGRPWIPPSQR